MPGMHAAGVMAEATDEELVDAAGHGDSAAFTRLVARHAPRLQALVTRVLGGRADADDVVQEVFIRAWVHAPSWRPSGTGRASYAAWLARTGVNLAIDRRRRRRPSTALDAIAEPVDPAAAPDAVLLAEERMVIVRKAVAALPERQRMAIGLAYDAELSNAEAAEAMGTSLGAYELLLVRARRSLRTALHDV
jgi:RNA polymerase sigma-70 factor (ECF subfamily)